MLQGRHTDAGGRPVRPSVHVSSRDNRVFTKRSSWSQLYVIIKNKALLYLSNPPCHEQVLRERKYRSLALDECEKSGSRPGWFTTELKGPRYPLDRWLEGSKIQSECYCERKFPFRCQDSKSDSRLSSPWIRCEVNRVRDKIWYTLGPQQLARKYFSLVFFT